MPTVSNNELITVISIIVNLKAATKFKTFSHDTFQSAMSFANSIGLYIALIKKKEGKVISDFNVSACDKLVTKVSEIVCANCIAIDEVKSACKNSCVLSDIVLYGQDDPSSAFVSLVIFQNKLSDTMTPASYLIDLILPYLHKAHITSLAPKWEPYYPLKILTTREKEVYNWMASGKTNREIAMILGISPFTVKNHVAKILEKLNAPNRSAALAICSHV